MAPTHAPADVKNVLQIDWFVLQIHDASFPSDPDEDLGRGTPYSRGAERFFNWAAGQGFNAIQFGPRGMTGRGNPSPYDATIFSRNPLDLPLRRFVDKGQLSQVTWESIRSSLPPLREGIAPYPLVYDACQRALNEIVASTSAADRAAAEDFLAKHESWLIPDALYQVLSREHGSESWHDWNRTEQGEFDQRLFDPPAEQQEASTARIRDLRERNAEEIKDYALIQWLLVEEQRALRQRLSGLGLALFGDLQVGLSHQDVWAWQRLLLADYRMGAPPSRTTMQGQAWCYAVLDPAQFGTPIEPGPALQFVKRRIERTLAECDGLRIDHPHGWVDPWVYLANSPDPLEAVRKGARLFSSPADPQHPQLAKYAIARPDQIDLSQPLHADGHVAELDDEQVSRYSILVDEIVAQQSQSGATKAVACEVLSTLPYPVGRVLERHDLGRFRVTQKIDLANPRDVYRIENADPQDWIMLGTHDTPSIWQLAENWCRGPEGLAWGKYLAELLAPASPKVELASDIATSAGKLVNSCFAAMLASQARKVVVFFPDLLGITSRYNEPGVVSTSNWSLRLASNFEEVYAERLRDGLALNLKECVRIAVQRVESDHQGQA
jgi:4-alpha-glucanotransferase